MFAPSPWCTFTSSQRHAVVEAFGALRHTARQLKDLQQLWATPWCIVVVVVAGDEGPGKPRRRLGGMGADGSETDGLKKFSLGHGRLALSNDLSGKELCSRPQEAIEHHLLGGGRGHREAVKNPRNPLWWRGSSNAIIEDFQSVSPICLKGLPSKDIPQNPEVIFWCCMPGSSWCRKKWEVQI